jgi:hypothetical protein
MEQTPPRLPARAHAASCGLAATPNDLSACADASHSRSMCDQWIVRHHTLLVQPLMKPRAPSDAQHGGAQLRSFKGNPVVAPFRT